MTKDINDSYLSAHLEWISAAGVVDSSRRDGALSEIGLLVEDVPAEHKLDVEALRTLLLRGMDVPHNLERLRQVLVIETPVGHVVATFGPTSGRQRPARARNVYVRWQIAGVRNGEYFGLRRWRLASRIAKRVGIGNGRYVRTYLDLAIEADPGADLHKVWLQPHDPATDRRGAVQIVEDRRLRVL